MNMHWVGIHTCRDERATQSAACAQNWGSWARRICHSRDCVAATESAIGAFLVEVGDRSAVYRL
jgi:hypothetical protein